MLRKIRPAIVMIIALTAITGLVYPLVLTVGFDARNDTPARLTQFASAQGIAGPGWRLASADAATIEALLRDLGFSYATIAGGFDHVTQTTLVDADGKIYRPPHPAIMVVGEFAQQMDDRRGMSAAGFRCPASAPPSLIDYALSKDFADGVVIAGCAESACFHRLGVAWIKAQVAGERDPYLRARVPRERVRMIWTSALETRRFEAELKAFAAEIAQLALARLHSPLPPSVGPVKMAKQVVVAGRRKG